MRGAYRADRISHRRRRVAHGPAHLYNYDEFSVRAHEQRRIFFLVGQQRDATFSRLGDGQRARSSARTAYGGFARRVAAVAYLPLCEQPLPAQVASRSAPASRWLAGARGPSPMTRAAIPGVAGRLGISGHTCTSQNSAQNRGILPIPPPDGT